MNKTQKQLLLTIGKKDQIYTSSQLANQCNIKKSLASYHLKTLIKNKFIREKKIGNYKNYFVTKKGLVQINIKILTPSEKADKKIVKNVVKSRPHDLRFKAKIIRSPSSWFGEKRLSFYRSVPLKNWNKLIRDVEDIIIEISPSSIVYRIDEIYNVDPDLAINQAFDMVRKVNKLLLKENPSLVLGEPQCLAVLFNQHQAIQNDPFALWCKKHGVKPIQKDIRVDNSKGWELEFTNPAIAHEQSQTYIDKYIGPIANGRLDPVKMQDDINCMGSSMMKITEGMKDMCQNLGYIFQGNTSILQHNQRVMIEITKQNKEIEKIKAGAYSHKKRKVGGVKRRKNHPFYKIMNKTH